MIISKFKYSFLAILLFMPFFMSANGNSMRADSIKNIENSELRSRIKQKIEDFQTYLGIICSKESSKKTLNTAVNQCLKLFIGEGDIYYTTDTYGNRIENDPVTIQITSKNRRTRTNSVKRYLTTLANNLNKMYTKVSITSSDAVRVYNIHETGDGRYECVAYSFQKFAGFRDGRLVFTDVTKKRVKIFLDQSDLIIGPTGKIVTPIYLGNIAVVENFLN